MVHGSQEARKALVVLCSFAAKSAFVAMLQLQSAKEWSYPNVVDVLRSNYNGRYNLLSPPGQHAHQAFNASDGLMSGKGRSFGIDTEAQWMDVVPIVEAGCMMNGHLANMFNDGPLSWYPK
jgi:hypothetical protein